MEHATKNSEYFFHDAGHVKQSSGVFRSPPSHVKNEGSLPSGLLTENRRRISIKTPLVYESTSPSSFFNGNTGTSTGSPQDQVVPQLVAAWEQWMISKTPVAASTTSRQLHEGTETADRQWSTPLNGDHLPAHKLPVDIGTFSLTLPDFRSCGSSQEYNNSTKDEETNVPLTDDETSTADEERSQDEDRQSHDEALRQVEDCTTSGEEQSQQKDREGSNASPNNQRTKQVEEGTTSPTVNAASATSSNTSVTSTPSDNEDNGTIASSIQHDDTNHVQQTLTPLEGNTTEGAEMQDEIARQDHDATIPAGDEWRPLEPQQSTQQLVEEGLSPTTELALSTNNSGAGIEDEEAYCINDEVIAAPMEPFNPNTVDNKVIPQRNGELRIAYDEEDYLHQQDDQMLPDSASSSTSTNDERSQSIQEESEEMLMPVQYLNPISVDNAASLEDNQSRDESLLNVRDHESSRIQDMGATLLDKSTDSEDSQPHYNIPVPLHMEEMSFMALMIKPSADAFLGIELTKIGWRFLVHKIHPLGLVARTDLRVGQTILAINGVAANDFESPEAMLDTLEQSSKFVIVATKSVLAVFRNGNTSHGLVLGALSESMSTLDRNRVVVSQLMPRGTDDGGEDHNDIVLEAGMKILAMNGKMDVQLYEANRILQQYSRGELTSLVILASETTAVSAASGAILNSNRAQLTNTKLSLHLEESSNNALAKLPPRTTSGLHFSGPNPGDWRILISRIEATSIFSSTSLQVGQTVLAVNGISVDRLPSIGHIMTLLEANETESLVSIVATRSVVVNVHKTITDADVGIAFSLHKGRLIVHEISSGGLFENTPLRVGMQVLAINDQPAPCNVTEAHRVIAGCAGSMGLICLSGDEQSGS
jgi:hypothetical protein